VVSSFEEKKKLASSHYSKLYTEGGAMDEELCEKFVTYIPSKILEEENLELNKSITEEEILATINQFNLDKAPGSDSFTIHFFKR
jgi:hypothetical protein